MSRRPLLLCSIALVLLFSLGFSQAAGAPAEVQDSDFSRFEADWPNTDFTLADVSASEITPVLFRDNIPPYYPQDYVYPDNVAFLGGRTPRYYAAFTDAETTDVYLPDEQQVISIEINGDARAFPLLLLNNHEIVNTEIGGVPVAVTFCPLCNASIVYEREVDGQIYHFGVSGLLRNSDLIMWDHETESWWQQFTGTGIVGTMTGTQLKFLPSLVVSWGQFKAQFPDGKILANVAGHNTNQISYRGYDAYGDTFLFRGERDERLFSTERVLGYASPEGAVAYPFSVLAEVGVVNDVLGGDAVVIFWQPGAVSLFTSSNETGSAGLYSSELDDGTMLTFASDGDVITDEQTRSTWNIFGIATDGELEGTRLEQHLAYPHFWFAWAAFRPDTLIWEPGTITDERWAQAAESD